MKKKFINLALGPVLFILVSVLLEDVFSGSSVHAIATLIWMVFWWVTRPVNITITAILPIVINIFYEILPMKTLTGTYISESIILIFGSGLLTIAWPKINLDRRIALKVLSLVGPSITSQIVVWLLASVVLSVAMPNVAVCALLCPIAVSMLKEAGEVDIKKSLVGVPILLSIGWGSGIGGAGSPLGGAMNLTAIAYMEQFTGKEFMYVDWVVRMAPYFVISTALLLFGLIAMYKKVNNLEGSKEYFLRHYKELGAMSTIEKISATMFGIAVMGSFLRPVYAHILPGLSPAYIFMLLGFITLFLCNRKGENYVDWTYVQQNTLWDMMILFGGGLALGELINGSGATQVFSSLVTGLSLDGGLITITIFVVIARIFSEITNSTTSSAIMIPIVISFCVELGLNPIPYWFITVMGFSAEFALPISVRCIPVSLGLDPAKMLKGGLLMTTLNIVVVVILSYLLLHFWPTFSAPLL